jgi:hypothetical protein
MQNRPSARTPTCQVALSGKATCPLARWLTTAVPNSTGATSIFCSACIWVDSVTSSDEPFFPAEAAFSPVASCCGLPRPPRRQDAITQTQAILFAIVNCWPDRVHFRPELTAGGLNDLQGQWGTGFWWIGQQDWLRNVHRGGGVSQPAAP